MMSHRYSACGIAQAWCVLTRRMTEVREAPRLVECCPPLNAVAEFVDHHGRIVGKPRNDIAVTEAAAVF